MIQVVHDLFANTALRKALYRARYPLAVLLLLPLARYMQPQWLATAFAISMAGQLIQTLCFASLVRNRELTVRGPYRLVRNPMYLGRFLMLLGFVLLLANPIALAVYAVVHYLYMVNRVRREERRLRKKFTGSFEEYCRNVNRFVPSLRGSGDRSVWFFDWGMFRENNAHWNILLTLAAYAALYLIGEADLFR